MIEKETEMETETEQLRAITKATGCEYILHVTKSSSASFCIEL